MSHSTSESFESRTPTWAQAFIDRANAAEVEAALYKQRYEKALVDLRSLREENRKLKRKLRGVRQALGGQIRRILGKKKKV